MALSLLYDDKTIDHQAPRQATMGTQQRLIRPHHWDDLPCGVYYRRALEAQLDLWWPKITGSQLLKWGDLSNDLACLQCKLPNQVACCLTPEPSASWVTGESLPLPYRHHWFDACLLAHTLSFAVDPQAILREADRLLTDQGWLFISGFNPISVLGLGKLFSVTRHQLPAGYRLLSRQKVLDWLSLLHYQIVDQPTFQLVPWQASEIPQGLLEGSLPLFGCQYLIVARKQTIPLQPIRPVAYGTSLWQEKPAGGICRLLLNGYSSKVRQIPLIL